MENNKREDLYFEQLLSKIRDVRDSEQSAMRKITEIIALSADYDGSNTLNRLIVYFNQLNERGAIERFANRLLLYAETTAKMHQALYVKNIEELVHGFIYNDDFKQNIYDYPSYQGVYEEDEDGGQVSLPEELQNFKGVSMVLKIEDMERLIDTFCSRNTYYRRAYAILADLDKQVLECVDTGVFPNCVLIPYKDCGDAIFEFSHFEVDLRDPDEKYRTLYVVYRYDTTVS